MDSSLPSIRDVEALRDSFGDGKPPEISRKIKACVACRKQKIKCHMVNGKAPCTRCKARSLPCTVNRSLQMLMEEDVAWKQAVTTKLQLLQDAMSTLANKLEMPELQAATQDASDLRRALENNTNDQLESPGTANSTQTTKDRPWKLNPQCEPSSMPASCIAEAAEQESNACPSPGQVNLVSKGILGIGDARALFRLYYERLDHLLYQTLGDHTSFDTVLESSPLLAAAVCTVASLHSSQLGHLFEPCMATLKHLVSSQSLSRKHSMDDIRGFCIGSFWLSSLSWALAGSAVRISIEIDLHSAIYRALEGERDPYMKTRLYYLVYVCDHHSSVIYGRPPMTRESASIRAAMKLLETENATEEDVRLVTQVKLWSIYSEILDCFGTDTCKPLSSAQFGQLRRFGIMLDTWYADWKDRFGPNQRVGNYPAKGVGLHFYFAKLYLCAHAFRGLDRQSSQALLPEQEEIANSAIIAATSILKVLISDEEIQQHLNGLPLCFDMMITFAIVFLIKVAAKYHHTVWFEKTRVLEMVKRAVSILKQIVRPMHAAHVLVDAAKGLEAIVQKCEDGHAEEQSTNGVAQPPSPGPSPNRESEMSCLQSLDGFENFDFQALLSDSSYSFDLGFAN